MPDARDVIDSKSVPSSPVFVDVTGRRRKRLRRLGYAAAALCAGYSIMIAISLVGGPVSPQTLLPEVVTGDGDTKAVPSAEHRTPGTGVGRGAFPPALPRPSGPGRTPTAPGTAGASGSPSSEVAPPGAAPSSPAPGNRRVRPRPGGEPTAAPGDATPAPATGSASPDTSPPAPDGPVGEEEPATGDEADGAAPQGAAATPLGAGRSAPEPAGARA